MLILYFVKLYINKFYLLYQIISIIKTLNLKKRQVVVFIKMPEHVVDYKA